ncbi:putative pyridoxamine phosphate oxidase [Piedraia hortae CBS 480.64]|uniref:Putative pyridoxamine phosphate oxidase n=1 Tax=Piedraia hortae CBS 480.64 TaxID=1314780 RepID=A0A6A7C2J6_9PEZI|nr:putative pyridoxamine phosphate oxidase [Piedraia hortae CBS 480.64]
MTSNQSSIKTTNLAKNPNASLLVHDWVSSRPPGDRDRSPEGRRHSSLATMLMQMNSAAVSSISVTINGGATVLEPGTDEDKWCREQHLLNNDFDDAGEAMLGTSPTTARVNGSRESYLANRDVRVVVVKINDGRISDWKGQIKDFAIG